MGIILVSISFISPNLWGLSTVLSHMYLYLSHVKSSLVQPFCVVKCMAGRFFDQVEDCPDFVVPIVVWYLHITLGWGIYVAGGWYVQHLIPWNGALEHPV